MDCCRIVYCRTNSRWLAGEGVRNLTTGRWSVIFQQLRQFRKISKKKPESKAELQEQGPARPAEVPPGRLVRPLLFTLGFSSCSFGAAAIWQYESLKSRVQNYFDQLRADWLESLRPQKRGGFRREGLTSVCHHIMPEGSQHGSQRSRINTEKWRSSLSSLSTVGDKMMSSDPGDSSSCNSVNTVSSDGDHPTSLSSATSSVSLQEASHSSSSSSSSSPPHATELSFNAPSSPSSSSMQERNSSDISLDLRPLEAAQEGAREATPQEGGGPGPSPTRQLSRLERVVLEIVETEQSYVRDLKSIVEDYLGPIVDCKSLPLSSEDVSTLFCNIEDIYEFSRDLLEDLKRSRHAAAIAECFVERSEDFDIYTLYCMNYPNCVSLLRQCLKNDIIFRFFNEKQTSLNQSLPVETYLLKPVQRILKYHLLLQELSRHVDSSDTGFEVVEEALVTMTAVAWYINDMKRRQELSIRLKEIEGLLVNWSGPSLAGFGDLVLEGSFRVQKVKKERAFFLFEKILLITKKKLHHFVYSSHIFCCNLSLVETLKDPLSFRVWDQNILKHQHTVQTRNQEEKRLWVHFLKKVMVENHPASLPHKARRLLGNPCLSALSDLDLFPAHQRSRRHSEPQGLLLSTPERGRRGRPLALDRTLSHRQCRRRSDPADLKSNGEMDLLQATSSDITSCVLQVKVEPHGDKQREQEEEDLAYVAPPTLSITEEILEIINQQTRTRERPDSPPEPVVLEQLEQDRDPPPELNMTTLLEPVSTSSLQEPALQTGTEDSCLTVSRHQQMEATDSLIRSEPNKNCPVLSRSHRLVEEQLDPSESVTPTSTLLEDRSHDSGLETSNNSTCGSMHELATSASQLDQSQTQEVRLLLCSELPGHDKGSSGGQVLSERSGPLELSDCENKSQIGITIPGPDDPTPEVDLTSLPGQAGPTMWKPTTGPLIKDSGPSKPGTGAHKSETENIGQEVPEKLAIKVQEQESCVEEQAGPDWNQVRENESEQGLWSSEANTVPRVEHEGLGSYLEGIKLFESSSASDCDPVVIQNSERILNRVQTLARMYSSRNAAIKVPSNLRPRSWGSRSPAVPTVSDHDLLRSKTETQTSKTRNPHQNQAGLNQNQISTLGPEISSPEGQQELASRLGSRHTQAHRATLSRPRDFLTLTPPSCTDFRRIQSRSLSEGKADVVSVDPGEPTAKKLAEKQPPRRATFTENHQDVPASAASHDLTKTHTLAALGPTKEKPTQTEAVRSPHKLLTFPSRRPDPHATSCGEPGSSPRILSTPWSASSYSSQPEDTAVGQSWLWSSRVVAGSHAPSSETQSFSKAFPSRLNTLPEPSVPLPPSTFSRSLAASFISQSINQSIAKRHSGQSLPFNAPSLSTPRQASTVEQQHQGLMKAPPPYRAHPPPVPFSGSDILEQDTHTCARSGQVTADALGYQAAAPCAASKNPFGGHTPIRSTSSLFGPRNPHHSCSRTECLPEHRRSSAHRSHGLTVDPCEIKGSNSHSSFPHSTANTPAPQSPSPVSGSALTPSEAPLGSGSPPSRGQLIALQKPASPVSALSKGQPKVGFITLMGGQCSPNNFAVCHGTSATSPSLRLETGDHIDSWEGPQEMLSSPEAHEQHLDEGHCRSQVICPYIMPSRQDKSTRAWPAKASTCLDPNQHLHELNVNLSAPHSTANPSCCSVTCSAALSRPAVMRASYATTVNLQITGRGCVTSFSTGHLSLSHNLPRNFSSRNISGGAEGKLDKMQYWLDKLKVHREVRISSSRYS
ncbi:LOW QUALITY PROTEIN: uncharacterized protein plekhg2 [Neosynchiropus ocellatus]